MTEPQVRLPIDQALRPAIETFIRRIEDDFEITQAVLFGSRARGDAATESDADVAIILKGEKGHRWRAAIHMAGIAFDVMQETGVLLDPLPLWEDEFADADAFGNADLIRNIRAEGRAV